MDDDYYKGLVRMTLDDHEHFIFLLNETITPIYGLEKQHTWLHVMGLIETWDIITLP